MLKRLAVVSLVMCASALAQQATSAMKLSAAQVAEKNVAARGGLERWRKVQVLVLRGEMEVGGNRRPALPLPGPKDKRLMPTPRPAEQVRLPFVMEMKRPLKSRIEVNFHGQSAVQVFDGASGWKLRPFLNRREVEPYTDEELKMAEQQFELDGPLVDYASKGSSLELVGMEKVGDQQTYNLKLTRRSGATTHIWIDAKTFLEAKIEGTPRRLDGRERAVEVYYRHFRNVDGLQIPFVLETRVAMTPGATPPAGQAPTAEQIVLNKVEVNAPVADILFSKASLTAPATVETAPPQTEAAAR